MLWRVDHLRGQQPELLRRERESIRYTGGAIEKIIFWTRVPRAVAKGLCLNGCSIGWTCYFTARACTHGHT